MTTCDLCHTPTRRLATVAAVSAQTDVRKRRNAVDAAAFGPIRDAELCETCAARLQVRILAAEDDYEAARALARSVVIANFVSENQR